jgi:hypothetical protein
VKWRHFANWLPVRAEMAAKKNQQFLAKPTAAGYNFSEIAAHPAGDACLGFSRLWRSEQLMNIRTVFGT